MKIAVNTRFLINDRLEGIGVFTFEIIRRLCVNYPQHKFYLFFDRKPQSDFIFSDNVIPVVLFPPARHPFLWFIWFEWSLYLKLKKIKPDIFISMDGMLPLKTNSKTVAIIHDLAFESFPDAVPFFVRKYYRYFYPKYAKKADKIITVSEYSKKDIAEKYNINLQKINVVFNGSKEIYQPLNSQTISTVKTKYSNGFDYIVYAGSLHPRKNIINLLRAFDLFKSNTHSEIKLLIAGRKAWQTSSIEQTYLEMKHKSEVNFTGWLPDEELAKVIASAKAMVYISLFEGFGIPVLDAMNCGIPVIVSNCTSLPEVAGDAGLYVNPLNIEEIAEKMTLLSRDNNLRNKLIENGNSQKKLFSWTKSSDKIAEIIFNL